MSVFSSRTSGYKAGVMLLFFSAIAFFVGYATPFWWYNSLSSSFSRIEGIWMWCDSATRYGGSRTGCASYPVDFDLPWFHAVRALECFSLIGLFAACVYALATNCCRTIPGPVTRILEALSAGSGVLGFIGCMVYVGEVKIKAYISWSFYLCTIGSVLCVVAAIIIAVCNKPLPTSAVGAAGQVITMATISQGQSYTTAGGQAQAQPYGNAQPYGYPQAYGNAQPYGNPQAYGNAQPYGNPQAYGNAQPYGNPQAYGNAQPYGNPPPYGNPQTYPSFQPDQTVKASYP